MNDIIKLLTDFSLPLTVIVTLVSLSSTLTTLLGIRRKKRDFEKQLRDMSEEEKIIEEARAYIESMSNEELKRFIDILDEREKKIKENEREK